MTRHDCIRGIVNKFEDEAKALLDQLQNDPDERVREEAADAKRWLEEKSGRV